MPKILPTIRQWHGNGIFEFMANINFTKTLIEKLEPPFKGFKTYKDAKENGLSLYITAKGIKTFFVRKWVDGKDERIILGKFPDLSIENARKMAQKTKGEIAQGVNPQEKKKALRDDLTFAELFEIYLERYAKIHKKTWKFDETEVRRLCGVWFKKKLLQITPSDVRNMQEKIYKENGLYMSNKVIQIIKTIFNKAIEWGFKLENPCASVKKYKEKSRDRFLSGEELSRFFKAFEELESEITKDYILISLLTGARKSNILEMQWKQINFDEATWKIPETKNGDPQTIPLTSEVMEILEKRKRKSKGVWVFESKESKTGHLVEPKRTWATLLKKAEIEDLRLHDLRRTFGSYQAITGSSLAIIGKSLGHKSQTATAIYARLDLDPVRNAVETATRAMLSNKIA